MTETEIQAEGFKKLAHLVSCGKSRTQIVEEVNKTLADLAQHHSTLFDLKHELARTRLVRLPHAQFVYWPYWQHPRMLEGDSTTYLQESYSVYEVPKADAFERLADIEHQLWGVSQGETKVFWRDWTIIEIQDKQLRVSCTYCAAYILSNGDNVAVVDEPFYHSAAFYVTCGLTRSTE